MGEEGQGVQSSSYRINNSWGVLCSMVTTVNTALYVGKLLGKSEKFSSQENELYNVTNVNWPYSGDHCPVYANAESLCRCLKLIEC